MLKLARGGIVAWIVAAASFGATACSSSSEQSPLEFGKVTALVGGVAWRSRAPGPVLDTTVVAVYAPSTGRLWIGGYGTAPPAPQGGVVEDLFACVPLALGPHIYSLGAPGAGPYALWIPGDTNTVDFSRFYSGTPAGTLTIAQLDLVGDTIRGSFSFEGYQSNGSKTLQVSAQFYGRIQEVLDNQASYLCQ